MLVDAEVRGRRLDIRLGGGRILEVGPRLTPRAERILQCHGGALIPGLHDHHLHLNATAGARRSVQAGPPQVGSIDDLGRVLAAAPGDDWVRAVGYHESVAGPLDRHVLDALVADRPVRVQHRSGALWVLNSSALERVAGYLDRSDDVERDASGRPSGRLWRYDRRLLPALPDDGAAQRGALRMLTQDLLGLGLTGVTDATPDLDTDALTTLQETLPLRLHLLGAPAGVLLPERMTRGPRKILLRDHDLPSYEALRSAVDPLGAGRDRAPVAVHCVTRESLLLTLAVVEDVGSVTGDRIEHAAVIPPGTEHVLARLGVAVVTQPDFLRTRGEDYLRDVDPEDRGHLYRWASLTAAGVAVAGSSDAPYGEVDPWQVIRSARDRSTTAGTIIAAAEAVAAAEALRGYLSAPEAPGGRPRRVAVGAPADLCLLKVSLEAALADPCADVVALTVVNGVPTTELQ